MLISNNTTDGLSEIRAIQQLCLYCAKSAAALWDLHLCHSQRTASTPALTALSRYGTALILPGSPESEQHSERGWQISSSTIPAGFSALPGRKENLAVMRPSQDWVAHPWFNMQFWFQAIIFLSSLSPEMLYLVIPNSCTHHSLNRCINTILKVNTKSITFNTGSQGSTSYLRINSSKGIINGLRGGGLNPVTSVLLDWSSVFWLSDDSFCCGSCPPPAAAAALAAALCWSMVSFPARLLRASAWPANVLFSFSSISFASPELAGEDRHLYTWRWAAQLWITARSIVQTKWNSNT